MNPFAIALGGGILSNVIQGWGQQQANNANIQIARENRDWNEAMWNKQNAYNTPSAQMQRYVDAGLNPNLIYGSGASGGNAGSVPSTAPAHVESVAKGIDLNNFMQTLSQWQQIKQSEANTDLIRKNSDLVQQKAINEAISGSILKSTSGLKTLELEKSSKLLPTQVSTAEESLRNLQNKNREILYRLDSLNPETLKSLRLGNLVKSQELNELNPSLLRLRETEILNKILDYQMNSGLKPYGVTSSDNVILRLLLKAFAGNGHGEEEYNPYE